MFAASETVCGNGILSFPRVPLDTHALPWWGGAGITPMEWVCSQRCKYWVLSFPRVPLGTHVLPRDRCLENLILVVNLGIGKSRDYHGMGVKPALQVLGTIKKEVRESAKLYGVSPLLYGAYSHYTTQWCGVV